MAPKNFIALCAVTGIAVIVAGWIVASRPAVEASDFDGTLAFADLIDRFNELDAIQIRHKDGTFNLQSGDFGWVFAERDNYPVQTDKIGELLVKLSRMEKVEPKTKLPDRYDRLDLVDPTEKEDSRAKEVVLLGSDGETLASLLVGKRKFTLGSTEGGTYILLPDDPQAWLVTGELNPGSRARDWLVREISDIKDDDIKRITITHPDGEVLVVSKESPDQSNYGVEDIPAGMEVRRDTIANDTGRVLSNLLLDDVKDASEVEFSEDQTIEVTFEGFTGFVVTVDLIEDGDQNWLRFRGDASAVQPLEDNPSDLEPAEGEEVAAKDWNAIIAELNRQTDGWVYQLPGYEVSGIKKRMADMVREPEEDDV